MIAGLLTRFQKIILGLVPILLLGATALTVVHGAPTVTHDPQRKVTESATALEPLVLAVHPYLPAAEIIARFTPLAEYLARAVGKPVVVRVGSSTGGHIEAVGRNRVDIAFIGPYAYVKMALRYGAKPLLARTEFKGKQFLSSYIVVRSNSPLRNLSELRGKRFAFGDPDAIMSTIMPRYALHRAGVDLDSLGAYQYIGSQANIALGILNDDYDAGVVREEFYDEFGARGLRILAHQPEVPTHLFVSRSDMPTAQVKVLRQAMLKLQNVPDGDAILRAISKGMTAMAPVTDADYDSMRKVLRMLEDRQD